MVTQAGESVHGRNPMKSFQHNDAAPRYSTFVSYRRADNADEGQRWAEWVMVTLESYNVPKALIGKDNTQGGNIPATLYPVFRDEAELAADANLPDRIREALTRSDSMIVICSPGARQSRFVAEEIRYFKQLGRAHRIFPLIIDGEPNANVRAKAALGIDPELECFPEAIRTDASENTRLGSEHREEDSNAASIPLGADVRPQYRPQKGYTSVAYYRKALKTRSNVPSDENRLVKEYGAQLELARLKLIAGILGVPLRLLRERDAAYRAERFRKLALVFGSIAAVAVVASVFAIRQTYSAEMQKQNALASESRAVSAKDAADELIRYMQYDLSATLGEVGRLDLMKAVNTRIRNYAQQHPGPLGTDAALAADREKAVALVRQGELSLKSGHLDESLQSLQEAMPTLRGLVQMQPSNLGNQRNLSQCLRQIGAVQKDKGEDVESLATYQHAATIDQVLVDKSGGSDEDVRNLAMSLDGVGQVQLATSDFDAAQRSFDLCIAHVEALVTSNPNNAVFLQDLASFSVDKGDLLSAQHDYKGALKLHKRGLEIARRLLGRNPANTEWQRILGVCLNKAGKMLAELESFPAAIENYKEALSIFQRLADRDAANTEWLWGVALLSQNLGNAEEAQNHFVVARENYERGLSFCKSLVAKDASNVKCQKLLWEAYQNLGDVLLAGDDMVGALEDYQKGLEVARKLAAKDGDNLIFRRQIWVSLNAIGGVEEQDKDLTAAAKTFRDNIANAEWIAARAQSDKTRQKSVIASYNRLGFVLEAQHQYAEALRAFEAGRAAAQKLLEKTPDEVDWQFELAQEDRNIGKVLWEDKRKVEAHVYFERYRGWLEPLAASNQRDYSIQTDLAFAYYCIGSCGNKETPAGRAEALEFYGKAVRKLRELLESHGLEPEHEKWLSDIGKLIEGVKAKDGSGK
ncbi:MAG TPA: toll/interleukin-1 receptor domain-containing protein [Candidatus Acidoferrum sp.]|nr:toll/interleukin-1 receptor domain-containing protein [Candidatus Acidoferrum sp.]